MQGPASEHHRRAVISACCTCWLLLHVVLVTGDGADAASPGSVQEQRNAACSFVQDRAKALSVQRPDQSTCNSAVKCLISELGWPTTGAELFVAYLAAVQDYCTALSGDRLDDMAMCDQAPFCRALLPDADGNLFVETQHRTLAQQASRWYYVVAGKPPKYECRPDWFSVLTQPCDGSAASQMQHCLQGSRDRTQDCPTGCNYFKVVLETGYCNQAQCWPPWVLEQLCNSTVQEYLQSTRADFNKTDCVQEACVVAARYVQEFSWTGFQGQCGHTAAVDRVRASARSIFAGEGCSVQHWVDTSTFNEELLLSKVCQGTYSQPAYLKPLLLNRGAVGKVWLDAAASASTLLYASTMQASLLECPTGYTALDNTLSQPWLSRQLLEAVLPPGSAWRVKLLPRLMQGIHPCDSSSNNSDMCVSLMAGGSGGDVQGTTWVVPNTSMSVLEAYCRQAFAPDAQGIPLPPANITATCNKVTAETERIRHRQAAQRAGLAVMWCVYVIVLMVGFLVMELSLRLPQRCCRGWFSRSWVTDVAEQFWEMLCPAPLDYHQGESHAAHAGQLRCALGHRRPSAPGSLTSRLRVLLRKSMQVRLALAYFVDVGLDIWTLVELRKIADQLAAAARAYPAESDYSTHLSWRSQHSNMLFWWLLIVFLAQYASGILLTLPSVMMAGAESARINYQQWLTRSGALMFTPSHLCTSFITCMWIPVLALALGRGVIEIIFVDTSMLLTLLGVPASSKLTQVFKNLNFHAYTTIRFMCEGILEALPSALISTAAINQQLLSQQTNTMQLTVFWMSLLVSMFRVARELYKLEQLTHNLDACCFLTAIMDVIHHLLLQQPVQSSGAARIQNNPAAGADGADHANTQGTVSPRSTPAAAAAASHAESALTAPQPYPVMTRLSGHFCSDGPHQDMAGADNLSAGVSQSAQSCPVASSTAAHATGVVESSAVVGFAPEGGLVPDSTSSRDGRGCCSWSMPRWSIFTLLEVYYYCCLGGIMVYLLLVCSDIAYPWLMSADTGVDRVCVDAARQRDCVLDWYYTPPSFAQQYNLLMMITSVPGVTNGSAKAPPCVLPSLTCD